MFSYVKILIVLIKIMILRWFYHKNNNFEEALQIINIDDYSAINIYTDSKYSINCITKWIKTWIKNVMRGMGGAVVSEKSKTVPPKIGDQPYKDTPKKGLL